MRSLVIEGLRIPDDPIDVDDEWLIRGEDLIFADVPELGGAVPVGGLDPDDLVVDATLVHLTDVARLGKRWGILVHVRNGDVDGRAANEGRWTDNSR